MLYGTGNLTTTCKFLDFAQKDAQASTDGRLGAQCQLPHHLCTAGQWGHLRQPTCPSCCTCLSGGWRQWPWLDVSCGWCPHQSATLRGRWPQHQSLSNHVAPSAYKQAAPQPLQYVLPTQIKFLHWHCDRTWKKKAWSTTDLLDNKHPKIWLGLQFHWDPDLGPRVETLLGVVDEYVVVLLQFLVGQLSMGQADLRDEAFDWLRTFHNGAFLAWDYGVGRTWAFQVLIYGVDRVEHVCRLHLLQVPPLHWDRDFCDADI